MTPFQDRIPAYLSRVEDALDARLPAADAAPEALHSAMRYSVLGGGKRIRPLLCYAAGETLGIGPGALDDAACAVELIHAFSLVHDDLPAMDDDELRRGRPTTHKAFDTATAILAGDALQTLAFNVLARGNGPGRLGMLRILADATGSEGMTGGQAMDLAAEGREISLAELETLHRRKTGCLIHSAVAMACCACPSLDVDRRGHLDRFAANIGLAFQIRDDVLDVEGDTAVIGKTQGADAAHGKSTYPALMGLDAARQHADEIYESALAELEAFGGAAEPLRWMAEFIVRRDR
ncbi:MAG TPA: farnesyl diphosphate synthase [Gammaproteobacteria bacterium]|nr:farnesyl diphosphate synthase [Gammaproteobacteria bacterium]